MDDNLLVRRAREGSREAFEALVELHQARVYSLALRMTGSPEDAADLSQEAFLKAWRGLASFRGGSSFSTWLYRLASNVCLDFLRREKRRRGLEAEAVPAPDGEEEDPVALAADNSPSPHDLLEEKERAAALSRGLAQLSPEHRQVLLLREVAGLSYAEIAAAAGLEEGTVKSRIARARLALRNLLREDGNFFALRPSK